MDGDSAGGEGPAAGARKAGADGEPGDAIAALLGLVERSEPAASPAPPSAASAPARSSPRPPPDATADYPLFRLPVPEDAYATLGLGSGIHDPGARVVNSFLAPTSAVAVVVDTSHAIVDVRVRPGWHAGGRPVDSCGLTLCNALMQFLMCYDVHITEHVGEEPASPALWRMFRFETYRELHAASLDCPAQLCEVRQLPGSSKNRVFTMPRTKVGGSAGHKWASRIFPRGLLGLLQVHAGEGRRSVFAAPLPVPATPVSAARPHRRRGRDRARHAAPGRLQSARCLRHPPGHPGLRDAQVRRGGGIRGSEGGRIRLGSAEAPPSPSRPALRTRNPPLRPPPTARHALSSPPAAARSRLGVEAAPPPLLSPAEREELVGVLPVLVLEVCVRGAVAAAEGGLSDGRLSSPDSRQIRSTAAASPPAPRLPPAEGPALALAGLALPARPRRHALHARGARGRGRGHRRGRHQRRRRLRGAAPLDAARRPRPPDRGWVLARACASREPRSAPGAPPLSNAQWTYMRVRAGRTRSTPSRPCPRSGGCRATRRPARAPCS